MTERRPIRAPWEIPIKELTKFHWLLAVNVSDHHRSQLVVRDHAKVLCDFADPATNLIWASQATIQAQAMYWSKSETSEAINALHKSAAIFKYRIGRLGMSDFKEMPEEIAAEIKKRSARGLVYRLNMRWAHHAIQQRHTIRNGEPEHLRVARLAAMERRRNAPQFTTPVNHDEVYYGSELSGRTAKSAQVPDFDHGSELRKHHGSELRVHQRSEPNKEGYKRDKEDESPSYQEVASTHAHAHTREEEPVPSAYDRMNEFFYDMEGSCPGPVFEAAILDSGKAIEAAFEVGATRAEVERIWNDATAAAARGQ
jgi:hypothetical protein